jgi:ligand-binding sensor protein
MIRIQDFVDMKVFEQIMSNWAEATGLATVAVGADGKYISKCYNFTDFCIKLTRASTIGCARCEQCDRTGHGVYHCHAGLIDFGIDLVIDGQKVGSVIGGQVLPNNPDEEKFRNVAREIGVDEERYIKALRQVNVRSEKAINASANLLGQVLNNYINAEYNLKKNSAIIKKLTDSADSTAKFIEDINKSTKALQDLQYKQKILALNASIEAARVGDVGAGFNVVAKEVEKLSNQSATINKTIASDVKNIDAIIKDLAS